MTHPAPDIVELRRHAEEARDGVLVGGVRVAPHVFCTVHWEVMIAVLDATDQPRVNAAHLTLLASNTAAELNHALAHSHERSELLRLSGRLVRQLSALTERNAA